VTRRLALVLAVVLVVLTGCGVRADRNPRDIPESQRGDLGQGAAPEAGEGTGPKVFFVDEDDDGTARLRGTSRAVLPTPAAVISELLKGLTATEQERRWRTAIPAGTQLRSAVLTSQGIMDVDLSDDFFLATGEEQVKAVAQVVFTASGLDGVNGVRILVDGRPREWPRGDGVSQSEPLTSELYPELNPSSQPEYPPPVAPEAPTTTTVAPTTPAPSG
jgi:spore germination protein GerM